METVLPQVRIKLESRSGVAGAARLVFRPTTFGYVNDHCLYKNRRGDWVLLGTGMRRDYRMMGERTFCVGVTPNINRPMTEVGELFAGDPGRIRIAPFVYTDEKSGSYHLFFSPQVEHYVSRDGVVWTREKPAIRTWWPSLRDSHVIEKDGDYYMYVTAPRNRIAVYGSKDLYTWEKAGEPLVVGDDKPRSLNSSCESANVFYHKNGWYLSTTIVPARYKGREHTENYLNTVIFRSDNPLSFGVYTNKSIGGGKRACVAGFIQAHAPEIVKVEGKLWYTTCGWKGWPKPVGITGEGVFMRELVLSGPI